MTRIFLETERLVLRWFTEADVDNLSYLDRNPEVMRFLTDGRPTPRDVIRNETLPELLRYYERFEGFGLWAAVERYTGEFLGWFEFRSKEGVPWEAELGYRLKRSAWGNGYATEGSRALICKGFTKLGLRRVFARTMAINTASRRVIEKVGLRCVRTFREEWTVPTKGAEHGEVEYALTRADRERREAENPTELPDPGESR